MNLDEFGDVIKNLGLSTSKDQLKTLMKEIDLDGKKIEASKLKYFHFFIKFLCITSKGNGEVEFNEFAIWMSIKQSDKNQISMDLENTFKIFDENGDHFIVRTRFYLIERRILSKYF